MCVCGSEGEREEGRGTGTSRDYRNEITKTKSLGNQSKTDSNTEKWRNC